MKRILLCCAGTLALLAWSRTPAREIFVVPTSNHQPLTCSTDDLSGYQVLPRQPLKLDVVGPGTLSLTVRLNHNKPHATFSGKLNIVRNDVPLKAVDLSLFRSRTGDYMQNKKLLFSLPKKLRIAVPEGVQRYTFSIKPENSLSMYLAIQYESDADQSAVARDDVLALVPLGEAPPAAEDLPLVPLTQTEPPAAKPPATEKPAPATPVAVAPAPPKPAAEPPRPQSAAATTQKPPPSLSPPSKPKEEPAPVKLAAASVAPAEAKEPQIRAEAPPPPRRPVVSLGVKLGQISALQKVGGTSFTGSLDVRYILPVLGGRLSLGLEGGAYRYRVEIAADNRRVTTWVVPVSLQLYYRIPLGTWLEPFVSLGGDVFYCQGRDEHIFAGYQYASRSGMVFGGHLAAGLEGALGPGFVLGEVRAGISFGDPGTWLNSPNIHGLAALVGYRLVF